ncbi:SH3 domain-containing protein [Pseudoxanthomonas sacheonensis]|uniref:Cell wall-associated NlpC family hydrolase n=1 Tax=Pseudoxanthomonas sacheonensis TaxID=443615 RepID=A0ABU1RRH9_9GAMM|nr:SH3 domain-containing protein [Pseudoxanthomonas sacheonensis]MDR6840530.1 cell wall-associated NlpC family hydrolase [Pseudoxanthomonas sacheonensis]
MRIHRPILVAAALLLCGAYLTPTQARELPPPSPGTVPPHGVVGMSEAQLSPDFWVDRLKQPNRVVLSSKAIAAQNEKLFRLDSSMNDLRALPETTKKEDVVASISELSALPDESLYDEEGKPVPTGTLRQLVQSLDLDAIPEQVTIRYGLALKRTALRKFPTELRVFSRQGDTDIDRFQESALFPGTPVAISHRSRDGKWLWVASPNYKAWVLARDIVTGAKAAVFGHAEKTPYRIVLGAKVSTVFTREQPQLSELQLDMGVRVPLASVASDALVNGQHSYTSWVVELPVRDANGTLAFAPALLQKNQDTAAAYLPLTRANLIRQAFKFLGERYGWGHSYNGRDCSGFVSEVYRSMGVELPRNTSDQSISPALNHTTFGKDDGPGPRRAAVDTLQVGDLIYIPGHVMMMIGRIDGAPYVIHDTNGGSFLDADGNMRSMHLNAVSVTPLLPLRFNEKNTYVDRITSIVRIRP